VIASWFVSPVLSSSLCRLSTSMSSLRTSKLRTSKIEVDPVVKCLDSDIAANETILLNLKRG